MNEGHARYQYLHCHHQAKAAAGIDAPQRPQVGEIGIPWVTLAELEFGVAKSQHVETNQAALDEFVLPLEIAILDREAARVYGRIRAMLENKGMPIGPLDMMIGAHALSLGVALATNNTREFSRIKGLTVVDWLARGD